jgi:hypothetical protein
MGLWTLNEARRNQLEVIAKKLNLTTYSQVMNLAIDEFIAKYGTPVELRPEPPTETEKDKSHRRRVEELSNNMGLRLAVVRREIVQLSPDEIQKKYAIPPSALSAFRAYIKRTDSLVPKK